MKRIRLTNTRHMARGVGMIEILITVLVLSVGLLGIAALQSFSLQSNQVAFHRTIATNISYELIDHMRVNRRFVQDGTVPGLQRWVNRTATLLPNGVLTWQLIDSDTGEVRVSIAWTDDRSLEDDPNWTLNIQSRI